MNALLGGRYGIDIEIDPSCRELIADLEFTKEDANGAKQKTKNKDGVEERGHTGDALDYLSAYLFGEFKKETI
jgi:hypothetical protein